MNATATNQTTDQTAADREAARQAMFEQKKLRFAKMMRIEYVDLIGPFIKLLNNGQSFGFNVQTTFSAVGTTRKFKIVQWMCNKFSVEKLDYALEEFAKLPTNRVNPKRKGKRFGKQTDSSKADAAQVNNDMNRDTSQPADNDDTDNTDTDNDTDDTTQDDETELQAADDAAEKSIPDVIQVDSNISPNAKPLEHKQFATLLRMMKVRDHNNHVFPVWLPGPAGSGKTTAAMHAAKRLNLNFYHTGAVDTEYKLLGFVNATGGYVETEFYKAYKDGGVFLFDEVDASNPQALVVINAAIENGHCAFPNRTIERHPDFILLAAANTYGGGATHEYVGRNKLDAATVDRFVMLSWEYDEDLERRIAANDEWVDLVHKYRRAINQDGGIKHVVSPRASIRGAKYLAAGFSKTQVLEMVVRKGLTPDQWQIVNRRVNGGF